MSLTTGNKGGMERSNGPTFCPFNCSATPAPPRPYGDRNADQEGQGKKGGAPPLGSPSGQLPGAAGEGRLERAKIKEGFLFRAVDRHGRIRPEGGGTLAQAGLLHIKKTRQRNPEPAGRGRKAQPSRRPEQLSFTDIAPKRDQ